MGNKLLRYLPISLDMRGKRVVVAGAGEAALAKLRVLLKTDASIAVFGAEPFNEFEHLAHNGRIQLYPRQIIARDFIGAALAYAAAGQYEEDARVVAMAQAVGVLCNHIDHQTGSDFLVPAIVDRAPVTIAIGTEGAAPVLARMIKADIEALLKPNLGVLARLAGRFRNAAAILPQGGRRRQFWRRFFDETGPRALGEGNESAARDALKALLSEAIMNTAPVGHVHFVGAGPGDPELLTLQARKLLHEADVVIYDRLVSPQVLELARREARQISVGKQPGGPSWRQADINGLMLAEAGTGAQVVRLKSGDPGIYGRLDEEMAALNAGGVGYSIAPGITSAIAAAAAAKVSLTRRGRNSELRFLTGQDVDGFANHDWRTLAKPGATAAIYMGVAAAAYLQGRLLMHGAAPATPMSVVEAVSTPLQKVLATNLGSLATDIADTGVKGPAILILGIAPKTAATAVTAATATNPEAIVQGEA